MNATTARIDATVDGLIDYAHDEHGGDIATLLEDGRAVRDFVEDACYWQGRPYTPQFLANVFTAARERAAELDNTTGATE